MSVNLPAPNPAELYPIAGVRIGVTEAGIRKAQRKDLTVMLLDAGASVAAVFTRNRFCAAPVQICREHLASGQPIRALLINTGNANAGTGAQGLERGRASAAALAHSLGLAEQQVLPFSTGVRPACRGSACTSCRCHKDTVHCDRHAAPPRLESSTFF